ncbi:MAG: hypothetical protein ACYST0_03470, partial [Planctomycetota bacterium]
LSGSGNIKKQEFRAIMAATNIEINAAQAAPFSPGVAQYLEQTDIGGLINKVAVWFELRAPDPEKPDADRFDGGISIEYENVHATPPHLPYPLRGARGKVFASTAENGTLKFQVDKRGMDGDLQVVGKMTNCFSDPFAPVYNIKLDAPGVLIGPRLEGALNQPLLPIAQRLWQAFAPVAGRLDGKLHLWNENPGDKAQVSADLKLIEVAGSFQGFPPETGHRRVCFPYPLSNIRGQVQVRPDGISLSGFTADAGKGQIQMTGNLIPVDGRMLPALDIDCRGVAFSPALRNALDAMLEGGGDIYDDYMPQGTTDISVQLRAAGNQLGYAVRISPLGASMTYKGFPYRVDGIHGTVKITEGGVQMNLDGRRRTAAIAVNGRFRFGPEDGFKGLHSELWVKTTGLALDNEMKHATTTMSDVAKEAWDFFSPRGRVDCEVTLWKDASDASFDYDAHMIVHKGSALMQTLEVPLENLEGDIFIHGTGDTTRCDFSSLRGQIRNGPNAAPANILCHGTGQIQDGKSRLDLTSIVRRIRLTRELATALDKAGVVELTTWDLLAPDGYVDVIGRLSKGYEDEEHRQSYRIRLRDTSSTSRFLPGKATDFNGDVAVEKGKVTFDNIRFKIGASPIRCSGGSASYANGVSTVKAKVNAESFPMDERVARLMSGPTRTIYLSSNIGGTVKVTDLELTLRFPDSGTGFQTLFSGQVVANNLEIGLAIPIRHINGVVKIDDGRIDENGGHATGTVSEANALIHDHQVHRVSSDFTFDQDKVQFQDLSMRLHAGRVESNGPDNLALRYDFAGEGNLQMFLRWYGVSLAETMRASGMSLVNKFQGSLEGNLNVEELRAGNVLDIRANGTMRISNGNLGQVPVFSTIYDYLKPDQRPRFSSGQLSYAVGNRIIQLDKLELKSSILNVDGQGKITPDGYSDIMLKLRAFGGRIPFLDRFVGTLVQGQVYGYLREPRSRPIWLGQRRTRRRLLTPIPPLNPNDVSRNPTPTGKRQ